MNIVSPAEFLARLEDIASPAPRHFRPANREDDPRIYIDAIVERMDSEIRSQALVATIRSLENGSEEYRSWALHVMRRGESQAFRDALADLLTPEWPEWVHSKKNASQLFECLATCGGEDERLVQRALALGEFPENHRRRLPHFTTYHPRTHGLRILREHLANKEPLEPAQARRLGARYARDAPEHLDKLADALKSYDVEVREKFAEGAALRLDEETLRSLRRALHLGE